MIYLSTLLLSLFITISLIPVLIRLAGRLRAIDIPDARKVHEHPVPRTGGLAMAIGTFVSAFLWAKAGTFFNAYAIGAGIIVLFGIIDDLKGLSYRAKFAGQLAAALVAVFYGGVMIDNLGSLVPEGVLLPPWVAMPLTVVAIVGVTNAINLADGLDGLAGGISLLSFCCIGYLAHLEENTLIAFLSVSLIGAIFGFLRFNTYPASLFMGDTGSQFLGFSLITMSISLTQGTTPLSPILPLVILGFPVLDTLTVMFERIAEKRSPFSPDKKHFHHRLIHLGFYHIEAVFLIYVIQAILVTSAFIFRFYSEWLLLAGYVVFSGLILGWFFTADAMKWRLRRFDLIDRVIKGRLKVLKERGVLIIVSFKIVEYGVPLLLLVTSFLQIKVSGYLSLFAAGLTAIILLAWFLKREWLRGALTISLYLFIPFIIYLTSDPHDIWISETAERIYNLSFVVLIFFVISTLKLTKRKRGFKATPMDFLILFIAVIAPYVAGTYARYRELGEIAPKMLMMFFSYEVLMGELRGSFGRLTIMTVITLLVVTVRGFI
ncbi:MAG: putative undecaprenyl-phosphate N-acetylglucosaminyl 1-phosphate transferase [Syntrophorhabdus sp. PtaU1.Bin058]|nr:MAG: putative undecaprenyl-phosphate N-acetylglucosaminyl 1-phosphate transferase [Syntrophorhabdus sp. PtaU1.Bin058]